MLARSLRLAALLFLLLHGAVGSMPATAQPTPSSPAALRQAIDAVLDVDAFSNAFWGAVVVDLSSGETLYRRNAEKSFVPASNTKLYTTAAALDQLTPGYRYRTRLYVDGPVEDGVLRGNVIVRGAADPTLGGHYDAETGAWDEFYDATVLFRQWADSLRARGITRVDGDVVGDDDIVDDQELGYGWAWDDETFYYSAQLSGLSFNDNVVQMQIKGQAVGEPAAITWAPFNTDYVQVVNRTVTTAPDTRLDEGHLRHRGTNRIEISSRVPAGRTDSEEITVSNPTLFTAHVLRETLLRAGIPVTGVPVDVDDMPIDPVYTAPGMRRVAVHESRPLSEIATMINKPSMNLYADMLLKTLGVERPVPDDDLEPGSAEMGVAAAKRTFARAGADTSRIRLVDGSGLSRHNLVTPEMTAALLRYMWSHPDDRIRTAFYESLPVAGVDGTLRSRLGRPPTRENVRAKTGSLGSVSTLSGYVRSAAGTPLAFVLMSNHFTTRSEAVRRAQDQIVGLLAAYRR